MKEQEVLEFLNRASAVITGSHIVYASGKHGTAYVNKDAVYTYPFITSRLCEAMAKRFIHDGVEVVIAPAVGGVILSQ
jgi:orotate phosphoribosyltransferase